MILHEHCTDRLRFRCLTPEDISPLMDFFQDEESTRFLMVDDDIFTYAESWLHREIRRYDIGGGGLHAIENKQTGELIGQCGLVRQFVDGIPKWEVGYHLFREHWGNGYATEAAQACRDFCFENEMAETLISLIHPDNERSLKVAARNGMTKWKETDFKGQHSIVMRIRREEWELLTGFVPA
jgi:RimJ/RimL family protein N-acetyltransferase